MSIKEIEKAALALSPKERAELSFMLLESIDSDEIQNMDKIWQAEVEERYKQLKIGHTERRSADLVIKEAKSKYE
ncbi:MAG: addiction module protein [Ignavibacteriae bacterium HGW-Ignavibacteriae-3]|nr:MAG: addiction module protein [Ignavibacteriae bacterium HGW-Ignavibacteriae-3]